MVTIAKTKQYRELEYRHLKLLQLYSVMSELRLHTNKAVDVGTSHYYHNKLYNWGNLGPFLTASLESMMQVFYIELNGFVGAYWNTKKGRVELRKNDQGSLGKYLKDSTRQQRKKSASERFDALLEREAASLAMIRDMRGKLAHFKTLSERSETFVPGDIKVREILNELAEVMYLLGYRRGNKPHYIEQDDRASESTQELIDKLVSSDHKAKDVRKTYLEARSKWFNSSADASS